MRSLVSERPQVQCGDKFERWTVVGACFRNERRSQSVVCECDCGTVQVCTVDNLKRRQTMSCGCLRSDRTRELNTKHGLTGHRLVGVWNGMKKRCLTKTCQRYKDYGGRGITVCDLWKRSFQAFYDWAVANGWQPGLQLDRINNDGNYEPDNCRFVTPEVNSRNRRKPKPRHGKHAPV